VIVGVDAHTPGKRRLRIRLTAGREIVLPPPTPALVDAIKALDVPFGAAESPAAYFERLEAQASLVLATAVARVCETVELAAGETPRDLLTAASLTYREARCLLTTALSEAQGIDGREAVPAMEALRREKGDVQADEWTLREIRERLSAE
jgi:hypothetical protein